MRWHHGRRVFGTPDLGATVMVSIMVGIWSRFTTELWESQVGLWFCMESRRSMQYACAQSPLGPPPQDLANIQLKQCPSHHIELHLEVSHLYVNSAVQLWEPCVCQPATGRHGGALSSIVIQTPFNWNHFLVHLLLARSVADPSAISWKLSTCANTIARYPPSSVRMSWGPYPAESSGSTSASPNQVTYSYNYGPSGALEPTIYGIPTD